MSDATGAPRRGVHFDLTINLGHVMSAGTFLVAAAIAWSTLDSRVSVLERDRTSEKAERREGDVGIETRLLTRITEQRAHMDQTQVRTADDIREIKTLMRDGFRDLDQKLDRKADKPGR